LEFAHSSNNAAAGQKRDTLNQPQTEKHRSEKFPAAKARRASVESAFVGPNT
jgi:hypothetical protein